MTSIGIIIVNYNSANDIVELYRQLLGQKNANNWRLVVVDNLSCEADRTILQALNLKPEVELIYLTQNIGFGPACNIGAARLNTDYLLLLNPDITLQPNTLSALISTAKLPHKAGIWGAVTLNRDNQPDNLYAWREPSISNMLGWAIGIRRIFRAPQWQDSYRLKLNDAPYFSVDAVTGCCLMIERELWLQLKGFDEQFFLYSEELDLCHRARLLGYQPTVASRAKLWHLGQKSSPPPKRIAFLFYGKQLYAKKHLSPLRYRAYWLICTIGVGLRALFSPATEQRQTWKSLFKLMLTKRLSYDQ